MMKLTADQIALNDYIAADNAAFEARCKAEGATFWCTFALTAEDLAQYGVYTIEQFKAWCADDSSVTVWATTNDDAEVEKEARKESYSW